MTQGQDDCNPESILPTVHAQVLQDGRVDGQRGDGHRQGLRQQGLHLRGVQEGEGQLPVPLQESGARGDKEVIFF